MQFPRTQNLKLKFWDTRAKPSPSLLWEWLACLPLSVFFPCLIDEMVCDRWCIESIIFSTGCLSMTKGTLLCKQGVTISEIMNASFIVSLSYGDPFVLKSNQSGHPSSMSGDSILRSCCTRWIEREILKLRRLLITFAGKWCLAPLAKTKKIRNFWLFKNNLRIIIPSTYLKRTEWAIPVW